MFLAETNNASIAGNLLGDFVKGKLDGEYPEEIQHGILMHRKIDSFTDRHSIILESAALLDQRFGRFRGIMLDIFFDYLLAINFHKYSDRDLVTFAGDVYNKLKMEWAILPAEVKFVADMMIQHDWLSGYAHIENIKRALWHTSSRSKRIPDLSSGIIDLQAKIVPLTKSFNAFFPELISYTKTL